MKFEVYGHIEVNCIFLMAVMILVSLGVAVASDTTTTFKAGPFTVSVDLGQDLGLGKSEEETKEAEEKEPMGVAIPEGISKYWPKWALLPGMPGYGMVEAEEPKVELEPGQWGSYSTGEGETMYAARSASGEYKEGFKTGKEALAWQMAAPAAHEGATVTKMA